VVNVAEHVLGAPQISVAVKITVLEPPHALGASPTPLLEMAGEQPPDTVAVFNQFA
jgi:hypothetical protein